jgi:hypothetical protein
MKTRANILKTVFGLVVLCLLGSGGVRADGTTGGSCQSCTIDINSLATALGGWSVQYVVDQDTKPQGYCCAQNAMPSGASPEPEPDDNRGLALSPDGKHLYAGYNTGRNPNPTIDGQMGEIRRIDTSGPVLGEKRVDAVLYGFRGKAIAVDHHSRVYLAEGNHELNHCPGLSSPLTCGTPDSSNRLVIYDADLDSQLFNFTIAAGVCPPSSSFPGAGAGDNCLPGTARPEGVAVVTQADPGLILYVSDRNRGTLDKFVSSNGKVTNWTFAGEFQVLAQAVAQGALRGMAVDAQGRIWIADWVDSGVFIVTWNSTTPSTSTSSFVGGISGAIDVGLDAVNAFVTTNGTPPLTSAPPQIQVVSQSMMVVTATLTPPYSSLTPPINPCGDTNDGCGGDGARLSGIAVTCPIQGSSTAGFFVANESGLTNATDPNDLSPQVCPSVTFGTQSPTNTCDREGIIGAKAGAFTQCPGCGKTTGGGQIAVTDPPFGSGNATFGFEVQQKSGGLPRGQLEYLDHVNGANYHSVSISSLFIDMSGTIAEFKGTIIQRNSTTTCMSSAPCTFKVHVEEHTPERHPSMDVFQIMICVSGPCDSGAFYSQGIGQNIKRGDIDVHQCKKDDD